MVSGKPLRTEWKSVVLGGFLPLRGAKHGIAMSLESERDGSMSCHSVTSRTLLNLSVLLSPVLNVTRCYKFPMFIPFQTHVETELT